MAEEKEKEDNLHVALVFFFVFAEREISPVYQPQIINPGGTDETGLTDLYLSHII